METVFPAMALKRLDFPTFVRPMTAMVGIFAAILLCSLLRSFQKRLVDIVLALHERKRLRGGCLLRCLLGGTAPASDYLPIYLHNRDEGRSVLRALDALQ